MASPTAPVVVQPDAPVAVVAAAPSRLPADAQAAVAQVDQDAMVLEQVRYGALRITEQKDTRTEERWRFASEAGGRFRIDYFGDTARQVVCDGKVLQDYIPALKAAHRYTLAEMESKDQAGLLGAILEKVSLPGIRTGWQQSGMTAWTWGEDGVVNGRPTRTVIGTDERGGRLTFVLDAERGHLVSARIEENGIFIVSTDASEHREVAPGVWLPGRVVSIAPAPGGKVKVELKLNQIAVGLDLPDNLFDAKLDNSIDVTEHP
jgi:hypothetical protein